jgi:hypothetical protein
LSGVLKTSLKVNALTSGSYRHYDDINLLRLNVLTISSKDDELVSIDGNLLLYKASNVDDVDSRIAVLLVNFNHSKRLHQRQTGRQNKTQFLKPRSTYIGGVVTPEKGRWVRLIWVLRSVVGERTHDDGAVGEDAPLVGQGDDRWWSDCFHQRYWWTNSLSSSINQERVNATTRGRCQTA